MIIVVLLLSSSGCEYITIQWEATGGRIEGDIRLNGHVKEQTSFARVSGYVEQNDVHSPQTTVKEALMFSTELRFTHGTPKKTVRAFVDEVMGLVELSALHHVIVSLLPDCCFGALDCGVHFARLGCVTSTL